MSVVVDTVGRALAYRDRRARLVRETSSLAPDPVPAFGVAPVKIVAEEHIQAIAFGMLDGEPDLLVRWNPLSRESGDLEPFAEALHAYLFSTITAGVLPRIWVPHAAALTLVDLLGHRYRRNQRASEVLRRMGHQCRVLGDEAQVPGQQAVAVAVDVLPQHVVTGQPPVMDRHLGALLAWVDPQDGADPAVEAERAALVPAAAMLVRAADERVERLRPRAKEGDRAARDEIEALLREGARTEWDLLVRARRAFWALSLPPSLGVAQLVAESRERLAAKLSGAWSPPSRPDALAGLLLEYEVAAQLRRDVDVRGDAVVRERARLAGRVIQTELIGRQQRRRGFKPCTLVLRTRQEVLRVRPGTALGTLASDLVGRVVDVQDDPGGQGTIFFVLLAGGVRSVPPEGSTIEWVDSIPYDGRFRMWRARRAVQAAAPPLAYGTALPPANPREIDEPDLAEVAARLRRS